ncbi:MAG: hypothetical protein Q8M58_03230, partial [Anaerolineales bacterium]|nr:hypothetical protein [Anaerolineales bacterium]
MDFLLDQIRSLPAYQSLLAALKSGRTLPGLALPRAARLPVLAALHADLGQPLVLVTDRADHALALHDELAFWLPDASRYIFSEPNPLFYEDAAWGNATRRERLQTLTALAVYHLPFADRAGAAYRVGAAQKPAAPPVIIVSARALMTRSLPRRDFLKASKLLKAGQSLPSGTLLETWVSIGYQPADTVLEPGQFSHRGGIFDIWPPAEPHPVRLDFFGDEIESIRRFDPATQRTIEKLGSVLVTPAREFLLPTNSQFTESQYTEFHIPILHPFPSSLLDYLLPKALVLVDDLSLLESTVSEIEEQAVKLRAESIAEGTLAEDFPVPYLSWSELSDNLQNRLCLELGHSTAEGLTAEESPSPIGRGARGEGESLTAQFGHIERFGGRLKLFIEYLDKIVAGDNFVVIISRQSARLEELWAEHHPPSAIPNPQFIEASLSAGWQLGNIFLITDS